MKTLTTIVGVLVLLAVIFGVAIFGASETGGEVITLQTVEADGSAVTTRLWVVEHNGHLWLRAGQPNSGWLRRLKANPQVLIARHGAPFEYTAVPVDDPALRDRIHELMAQNYGLADRFVSMIRDGSTSVPVRLDPR